MTNGHWRLALLFAHSLRSTLFEHDLFRKPVSTFRHALFGRGAVRPQLLDRQRRYLVSQGFEVGGHARKAARLLEPPLVHVERAVEFELDGVQAGGRVAVVLGDEPASIGLVAADRITHLAQHAFDGFRDRRDAARPVAVAEHHVGPRALVLGPGGGLNGKSGLSSL